MRDLIDRLRAPITTGGVVGQLGTAVGGVTIGLVPELVASAVGVRVLAWIVAAGLILGSLGRVVLAWLGEVGVVLDLDPGDRPWDGHAAQAAMRQARTRGRRTLISERLSLDPRQRVDQLDQVVSRLNEASRDRTRRVTVYVNAALHDAFTVGLLMRPCAFPVTVMQRSGKDSHPFYPAVKLGDHLRQPLTDRERRQAAVDLRDEPATLAEDATGLALMVALTAPGGTVIPRMAEAASTGRSREYALDPDDRRRAALTVTSTGRNIDPGLFELTVRYIYDRWSEFEGERNETGENLLFMNGPNAIALALGWLFGRGRWRFVAHVPPTKPTRPSRAGR